MSVKGVPGVTGCSFDSHRSPHWYSPPPYFFRFTEEITNEIFEKVKSHRLLSDIDINNVTATRDC